MSDSEYNATVCLLDWLESRVIAAGRGDHESISDNDPSGRFWLGRLASEEKVADMASGDRGERLEPCAIGIRIQPAKSDPWRFEVRVLANCWLRQEGVWKKSGGIDEIVPIEAADLPEAQSHGREALTRALELTAGMEGFSAEIRVEVESSIEGDRELAIMLVNTSPAEHPNLRDTRLYECSMEVIGLETKPFILAALPDSFRYDRQIPAYGINCGIEYTSCGFTTMDMVEVDRKRPNFWSSADPMPDLSFVALAESPLGPLSTLCGALSRWGESAWSEASLNDRATAGGWSAEMIQEARHEASCFTEELNRISSGVQLLESNERLQTSFCLMNRAMSISSRGRGYDRWRPFQIGFILANLGCIVAPEEDSEIADIVWFATGGGKTETYLGLLVTAALHDRMSGKITGVTAWTRFPLRMLSLQQLQRFADALAAAEIVRRDSRIEGSPLSLGFFVGRDATPNFGPDPDDEAMPERYRVLRRCPFCRNESLEMAFDRLNWTLEHRCGASNCPWPEKSLPFYIVDDEIYRFLPTVVVGTLDKAASISRQAAMRGLVGPPLGLCPRPGHGFTYAPRSSHPTGCLVPGCRSKVGTLPMEGRLFGPAFRLQDELHLLRDSLGAVDAHYEALLDGLELELCGVRPKILASSATLEGYESQVDVLYRRRGRVFPLQGPSATEGFWTADSDRLMRRFVAIAPRGLTIEYSIDRMLTELQRAVRDLAARPEETCREVGVDPAHAAFLLSLYGTDVLYGNTLRDLDAVDRSIQSGQIQVEGPLNSVTLTGRTDFESVRTTLHRLEHAEDSFADRIHVVTASSMMSHGVDIDRLNVMVMVGLPLGTAEFIQATARVGRRYPGLVFVIHKIGRERDAGVFRSFEKFVEQGDRFVEPIPITGKSRRVLKKTIAGLELARVLAIHEPRSGISLASLKKLREYVVGGGIDFDLECNLLMKYLGINQEHDPDLVRDLQDWFRVFRRNILQPLPNHRFPGDASPSGEPMLSLRDVEEQVPLFLNREL
jgi:Lhr-like helicase